MTNTSDIAIPWSDEILHVYDNRDVHGGTGIDGHIWTVSGDLRTYETQWDVTNSDIAHAMRPELGNLDVILDAESSCFFAYCLNQAEAVCIANLAIETARKLHGGLASMPERAEALLDGWEPGDDVDHDWMVRALLLDLVESAR